MAGVDDVTTNALAGRRLEVFCDELRGALRDGSYQPSALRPVRLPSGREVLIPTVRDHVVHRVLVNAVPQMRPATFHATVAAFRQAISQTEAKVVTLDVRDFYASLPRDEVLRLLAEHLDKRCRRLARRLLNAPVRRRGQRDRAPRVGIPTGTPFAARAGELVLKSIESYAVANLPADVQVIRYADDLALIGPATEVGLAVEVVREAFAARHLTVDADGPPRDLRQGVDWLGLHFDNGRRPGLVRGKRRHVRTRISPDRYRVRVRHLEGLIEDGASWADVEEHLRGLRSHYGRYDAVGDLAVLTRHAERLHRSQLAHNHGQTAGKGHDTNV